MELVLTSVTILTTIRVKEDITKSLLVEEAITRNAQTRNVTMTGASEVVKRVATEAGIVIEDGLTREVDVDIRVVVSIITMTRGKLTMEITSVLWREGDCSCRIWRLRHSGSI